jgi:hypothetical protein
MNTNLKTKIGLVLVLILVLVLGAPVRAQEAPPTAMSALQNLLNANDTNSLMHANELNVTPLFKWDSANKLSGGALKLDWWVSDQQGAFFQFEEYSDRSSYWGFGYQARTVFKGLEFSLGLGTRQDTDEDFGNVQLFINPTITKQIWAKGDWDIRLTAGCDVVSNGKPNPFLGVTFRATRF